MTKKILILDDDEAVLDALEAALEYNKFAVKTADKSDDIFKVIEEFKPDLVLVDYILAGINGGEICHQIKTNEATSHIPVILISAYPRVLLSLGDYGCDAFIAKPFDLSELIEHVNTCLHATEDFS
ncbi:two-component system response regulator [Arcticibacter sp. MXS-1]|uniref:response regulator n=1 Tax=Arcticibacter sp. MXS-1 TaxID=3341726 RepID=UPI0035A949F5